MAAMFQALRPPLGTKEKQADILALGKRGWPPAETSGVGVGGCHSASSRLWCSELRHPHHSPVWTAILKAHMQETRKAAKDRPRYRPHKWCCCQRHGGPAGGGWKGTEQRLWSAQGQEGQILKQNLGVGRGGEEKPARVTCFAEGL